MTTPTKVLKPAREGLIVGDPITGRPLAADGEPKPFNTHWRRRLRDGDVVEVKPTRGRAKSD